MIDGLLILKFIKFCVVGATGMGLDFGVTWLMKEKAGVNKYIANSSGFIVAASTNYILNRIWTFQSSNPHIAGQYLSFVGISVIGLGLNNLIIFLLHDRFRYNFYLSKLFAIVVVTVWNFLMNLIFTFR